jgi:hypothetical protein
MGKNKLIVKPEEEPKEEPKKEEEIKKSPKKESKAAITIKKLADGSYIKDRLFNNLPFVFFIAFLGIVYIANTYYAMGTIRSIEKMKTQIKELRYEYVSMKKNLIEKSRRDKVMQRLKEENRELKESKVPPFILEIKRDTIHK